MIYWYSFPSIFSCYVPPTLLNPEALMRMDIYYDGDCPLCRNCVPYRRLKQHCARMLCDLLLRLLGRKKI